MTTIIDSEPALAEALADLARRDPVMRELVARGARPPLRKREPGFAGLAAIIVSQQLSTASAGAIWKRLTAALDPLTPQALLAAADEMLRGVGLSAGKIATLRAIAAAVAGGSLKLEGLAEAPAEVAHQALCRVAGIGPWTADIYLLFCLGHPDILPAGDLALQEAARLALGLDRRPSETALKALAWRWRPWRGVAARILWAHYAIAKRREGAPVAGSAPPGAAPPVDGAVARPPERHPLLQRLAGGDRRSLGRAPEAVVEAIADPALVPILVEGLFADDPLVRLRAADVLEKVARVTADGLVPHADCLIEEIGASREAELRWNLALVLPRLDLDAAQRRRAAAILFRLLDEKSAILRVSALQALADLAGSDPPLARRLAPVLARFAEGGSAAVRARARKLARRIPA